MPFIDILRSMNLQWGFGTVYSNHDIVNTLNPTLDSHADPIGLDSIVWNSTYGTLCRSLINIYKSKMYSQ